MVVVSTGAPGCAVERLAGERGLGELGRQDAEQTGEVGDRRPERRGQEREGDAADAAQRDHRRDDGERVRAGQGGVEQRGDHQGNRVAEHVERVQDNEALVDRGKFAVGQRGLHGVERNHHVLQRRVLRENTKRVNGKQNSGTSLSAS